MHSVKAFVPDVVLAIIVQLVVLGLTVKSATNRNKHTGIKSITVFYGICIMYDKIEIQEFKRKYIYMYNDSKVGTIKFSGILHSSF